MRFWIALVVFFAAVFAGSATNASEQLSVEKIANPLTVASGGTVKILLNISNPFDSDLIVKIRDRNSAGGTTIDTQCIQGKIPAKSRGISEYESIQAYNPGTFTLGTIEVKYTNPTTGKEEVIFGRNRVDVIVTGGDPNFMFSSSSTKMECQFEEQPQQQQQQSQQQKEEEARRQQQQQEQQQQQMQNKLSQARQQASQDMNSVKNQMQKEADEARQRTDKELSDKLSENKDFHDMKNDLLSKGYQEKGKSRSDLRDNETDFKYDFEKPTGEKAEISGKMKDGEIQDLKKFSDDDRKELEERISSDKDFQDAEQRLKDEGFVPDKKEFSGLDNKNETGFNYQYKRADGETANITGDVKMGEVSDVGAKTSVDEKRVMEALSKNDDFRKVDDELVSKGFNRSGFELEKFLRNESSFSLSYSNGNETMNVTGDVQISNNGTMKISNVKREDGRTLLDKLKIPMLLLILLVGVYTYLRFIRKEKVDVLGEAPVVGVKVIDPKKEALKLIRKAEKAYDGGENKEAYALVSQGVRLYFKHVIASEKDELTTGEILGFVRGKKDDEYIARLKECFGLCDLVKFAKYKPNKTDFSRIVELAERCLE